MSEILTSSHPSRLVIIAFLSTALKIIHVDSLTLPKCCPLYKTLKSSECIVHNNASEPTVQIYNSTLQPLTEIHVYFKYQPLNCKTRSLHYDNYYILDNGSVYRGPEYDTNEKYCIENIPNYGTYPLYCIDDTITEAGFYINSIGYALSIPFCLITIIIYCGLKEFRTMHGKIIVGYLCGFGVSCLFGVCLETKLIHLGLATLCTFTGYAIQFFFMATFFWLNVMCFDIYWTFSGLRSLTGSAKEREQKKLILYSLYAWGFPLLILLVTLAIDYSPAVSFSSLWKPNVGVDRCFFKDTIATGIYFYMPMGIVILVNIILFSITAFRICTMRRETSACLGRGDSRKHDNKKNSDRERFSLYFKLFLVMGINWVMEVVSFLAGGPRYLWYIPDFTNTLQGVFIFIIFVWKKRVRRLVWARLQGCCGGKPAVNGTKSPWTASCRNTSSLTASSAVSQNSMKMQQISTPQNASIPPPVSESPTKNNL